MASKIFPDFFHSLTDSGQSSATSGAPFCNSADGSPALIAQNAEVDWAA